MNVLQTVDVREVLRGSDELGPEQIAQLQEAISCPQVADVRREVDALAAEVDANPNPTDAELTKVGTGLFFLGRHRRAAEYLSRVGDHAVAKFCYAQVSASLGEHQRAAELFAAAGKLGYDSIECTLRQAGEVRALGQLDEAEKLVRSTAPAGARRAEYSYQMGCILADRGDTYGAVEYFERAVDMDPHHARALFSLAAENALYGNDDEAIRLYERSLSKPPQYLGALLNLGLLYEDTENYGAAAYCFRRIVESDPMNQRARLYLRDIEAANHMYYDEEALRQEARLQHLLSRPVTDFELTVRSRNCLEGLGIRTLGDLTRVSEPELLAGKNFGETSLTEIKELLTMHGLKIGQHHQAVPSREPVFHQPDLSPQEKALMEKSISELNLSVRARKCMVRLGINHVAELVKRSADELLGAKNFGVTSLNEVRAKLEELGLSLRND